MLILVFNCATEFHTLICLMNFHTALKAYVNISINPIIPLDENIPDKSYKFFKG